MNQAAWGTEMVKSGDAKFGILAGQFALTLLSGLLVPLLWSTVPQAEDSLYGYCLFATALVPWMLWSWFIVSDSLFNPYGLFLVAAILFNVNNCVLHAFGLTSGVFLIGHSDDHINLLAAGAATLGVMSMHLGALLFWGYPRSSAAARRPDETLFRGPSIIGGLFVAAAIIPAAVQAHRDLTLQMSSSYGALHRLESATGFDAWQGVLAGFLGPAAFYFFVGRPKSRSRHYLTAALVMCTVLTLLFAGDRSDATMLLVAFLWLYDRCVKKIPKPLLVTVFIGLLAIYPLIHVTRTVTGGQRLSAEVWRNALSQVDKPVQGSLSEMGGSISILAYVIELVPDSRGFDWGMSYLSALQSIVPNFFGGLHPSVQRSLSIWLVSIVDPYNAVRGGGRGFSFLGEAYLNFGWVGIIVIPWLIGASLSQITRWVASTNNPVAWAAVACMLIFLPKFARAECLELVRPIAWFCFGLFFACALINPKSTKGLQRPIPYLIPVTRGLARHLS
jgi:hypothetical protein